jgi:hypothetical protein
MREPTVRFVTELTRDVPGGLAVATRLAAEATLGHDGHDLRGAADTPGGDGHRRLALGVGLRLIR